MTSSIRSFPRRGNPPLHSTRCASSQKQLLDKMERAIRFGESLVGAPYSWWQSGELCDDAPAWAGIGPPQVDLVFHKGVFCAGLVNLMLREIGLPIPLNPPYNGGTAAYGLNYKLHQFSLTEVRRGDAVFRPFTDTSDQGHIAIALGGGDDPVLQSFADAESNSPGVNDSYTVRDSHCGSYYQFIIKREDLWQNKFWGCSSINNFGHLIQLDFRLYIQLNIHVACMEQSKFPLGYPPGNPSEHLTGPRLLWNFHGTFRVDSRYMERLEIRVCPGVIEYSRVRGQHGIIQWIRPPWNVLGSWNWRGMCSITFLQIDSITHNIV